MSLDFDLTPDQDALRAQAQAFTDRELTSEYLTSVDVPGRAPMELLPKMAAEGFTRVSIPEEYGGSGGTATDVTVLLEAFGRSSVAIASFLNRALGWGVEALLKFGTESQKQWYLSRVCSGDMMFAFSHTEPGAGSDAAAIRTKARADGDHYVIEGSKIFTSGAAESHCLIVSARTDPGASRHRGLSVFLVDPATPGVTCRRIEKVGMRPAGTLCEVHYDQVRVPASALLGVANEGWRVVTGTLERARMAQAAYCVGGAQRTIDDAVAYVARERLREFTPMLVELQLRARASRLLLYRAAALIDEGVPCVREASMSNLHATETLVAATSECMRIYGRRGLTRAHEVERMMRDARLFIIGDGSSQIQRNLIARQMGL